MVIPNTSAVFTNHGDEIPPDPRTIIHYKFYKNILESHGYSFEKYIRPYDIWKDKFGNEIMICETCRILVLNKKKIVAANLSISYCLIDFLFNKKPTITNGNKQSDQSAG